MKQYLPCAIALLIVTDTARSEIVFEIGPNTSTARSTNSATAILQYRWKDRLAVGLGYMTSQELDTCGRPDCQWDIPAQFLGGVELLIPWKRLSLGVGAYYIEHVHRVSSDNMNARASLEYTITDHIGLKFSHFSNASMGREITICNDTTCLTDKFNDGTDSLMFVWHF